MIKVIRGLNYHFPWVLMMVLITLQSELGGAIIGPALAKGVDKAIHFFTFGVLGWLMSRGFSNSSSIFIRKNYAWLILTVAALFATLDEIHQMYTPGRMADFWDWLTDILGVLIFVMWFKKRNPLKVE